jgi:hypothetical protein
LANRQTGADKKHRHASVLFVLFLEFGPTGNSRQSGVASLF